MERNDVRTSGQRRHGVTLTPFRIFRMDYISRRSFHLITHGLLPDYEQTQKNSTAHLLTDLYRTVLSSSPLPAITIMLQCRRNFRMTIWSLPKCIKYSEQVSPGLARSRQVSPGLARSPGPRQVSPCHFSPFSLPRLAKV